MATCTEDTDDFLLAQLTEAEISELNELIDPDVRREKLLGHSS